MSAMQGVDGAEDADEVLRDDGGGKLQRQWHWIYGFLVRFLQLTHYCVVSNMKNLIYI